MDRAVQPDNPYRQRTPPRQNYSGEYGLYGTPPSLRFYYDEPARAALAGLWYDDHYS
jgi:hypothetical protein